MYDGVMRVLCGVFVAAALSVAASAVPAGDALPGVLLSRQLLQRERLTVGEIVQLASDPGGQRAQSFRIVGVYEPVPDPMRFAQERLEARLHLPDLSALLGDSGGHRADSVTGINVRLADPGTAAAFATDVTRRFPGVEAKPTAAPDERSATFLVLERFHFAIAIVTVAGSGVFLLALMVMLVDERRETVATLRLMGFTRARILGQVLVEGTAITLAGAAFGILFALSSQSMFNRVFQWRYDTALVFLRITPHIIAQSIVVAIPIGVLASLVAAWTILRRGALSVVRR